MCIRDSSLTDNDDNMSITDIGDIDIDLSDEFNDLDDLNEVDLSSDSLSKQNEQLTGGENNSKNEEEFKFFD